LIELEAGEAGLLRDHLGAAVSPLVERLAAAGIARAGAIEQSLEGALRTGGDAIESTCRVLGALAIELQRAAGHRVEYTEVLPAARADQCRLVFEYEHADTGADASEIAARLLVDILPGLRWEEDEDVPGGDADDAMRQFFARAPTHVLPRDAQAIIDAATRLDIPCVKLERAPYRGVSGEFRIRPNGLLKLGHACHQRIVDGTLCLERSARLVPLLFDRERLFASMCDIGLPVAQQDQESRPLMMTRRVLRAAGRLGYPVVLKPVKRLASEPRAFNRTRPALLNEQDLLAELERLRPSSPQVQVERLVEGSTWHVLVAGGVALCAISGNDGRVTAEGIHESVRTMAERAAAGLECGMLVLTVVTPDPGLPLDQCGGAVVSLDPAPQLDRLLSGSVCWLDRAADVFVRWLYPAGAPARIPLVAVTGTNGKTTTSRLIARIAKHHGYLPGLASTAGVYIDEQLSESGDLAGLGGHHLLFESRAIDFGVLETARGGVAHSGFMFDHCDVGVCLNVTEDHIGEYGIDTLADMVTIKRSILERATAGVVLNADYSTCLRMLPFRPACGSGCAR
jgi:hypothetical protein